MHTNLIKLWVILALGLPAAVTGQTDSIAAKKQTVIRKISIAGTGKISESFLLKNLISRKDALFEPASLERDIRNILRMYSMKNLYLIRIDSVQCDFTHDSSEVRIRIYVTENKEMIIGAIRMNGNHSLRDDDLRNVMNSDVNRFFEPSVLENDILEILTLYEDRGFPFAQVQVAELKLYEEDGLPKLSITLQINENQKIIISEIEVIGNRQTQKKVLLRELRLSLPRMYRRSEMQAGLARIRRFPFIVDAQEGELAAVSDSGHVLQLMIHEGPSNIIDGVAGYVPKNGTEKGFFTGLANLSFQNLFGTARRLDVRWQKINRYSQDFLIAYTEPWVLNYPVNLGFSMRQFVQDTTYVEKQLTLDGNVWIGVYGAGLFGAKLKYVDPADAATGFLYNIPTSQLTSAYIGLSYDTRDNAYNPRKGIFYKALIEYGNKKDDRLIENPAASDTLIINGQTFVIEKRRRTIAVKKITLDFESIFSVTRKWVLYNAFHGAVYRSPETVVPYSDQIRFGGLKTLRGYPEDFFNGTRVGWNNFELRWLTSPRSRIFTFVDLGYYYRKTAAPGDAARIIRQDGWPLGYGFGIRFETALGLFALDFGLGKNDTFSEGKIHFGIAGQF